MQRVEDQRNVQHIRVVMSIRIQGGGTLTKASLGLWSQLVVVPTDGVGSGVFTSGSGSSRRAVVG